jgi:hypothetical protein
MSLSIKGYAALIISPAKTITLVVPSPTSSSYDLEISSMDFAAGWLTSISLKIACPSLDKTIPPIGSKSIFNIDLGPNVDTMTSAIAFAALMLAICAFLPVSL